MLKQKNIHRIQKHVSKIACMKLTDASFASLRSKKWEKDLSLFRAINESKISQYKNHLNLSLLDMDNTKSA